jgi:hypothetical protein
MLKNCRLYLIVLLIYAACFTPAFCHGDKPHDGPPPSSAIPTVEESPSDLALVQRLFVLKRSQFDNSLLTIVAKTVERPKTIILPAKTIASPNGYAQIHVPQLARVLIDDRFPIPTTGEKVTANQVNFTNLKERFLFSREKLTALQN